ncbi:uncharacterized protein LOC144435202 isoform X2 [Glandiceps talaboti]
MNLVRQRRVTGLSIVVALITVFNAVNALDTNGDIADYTYDQTHYGPCQTDEDCPVDHVCLDGSGTCESCLAWVSLHNAPVACSDVIGNVVDDNNDRDGDNYDVEDSDMYEIKPCVEEWDCPLGQWCYRDMGTCESCSDLCKSQTFECEDECSRWLTEIENSKQLKLEIILSLVGAAFFALVVVVTICVLKRRKRIKLSTEAQQDHEGSSEEVYV